MVFAVTVAVILSSFVATARTVGRTLTLMTAIACAFACGMDLLRSRAELELAILEFREAQQAMWIVAVASGASLGLQPDDWFSHAAISCGLPSLRESNRTPVRFGEKPLAVLLSICFVLLDLCVCASRCDVECVNFFSSFAALFGAAAFAGMRGRAWVDSRKGRARRESVAPHEIRC